MTLLLAILALSCGSELRPQKNLTDPGAATALAPAPIPSTVAALGSLPRTARRRAYVVEGTVTLVKHESDSDLHIVLSDEQGRTMIIEAVHPSCATGSLALAAIKRARRQAAALRVGMWVRVTGVLFFDRPHGQAGIAPNAAELHPLLSVRPMP